MNWPRLLSRSLSPICLTTSPKTLLKSLECSLSSLWDYALLGISQSLHLPYEYNQNYNNTKIPVCFVRFEFLKFVFWVFVCVLKFCFECLLKFCFEYFSCFVYSLKFCFEYLKFCFEFCVEFDVLTFSLLFLVSVMYFWSFVFECLKFCFECWLLCFEVLYKIV